VLSPCTNPRCRLYFLVMLYTHDRVRITICNFNRIQGKKKWLDGNCLLPFLAYFSLLRSQLHTSWGNNTRRGQKIVDIWSSKPRKNIVDMFSVLSLMWHLAWLPNFLFINSLNLFFNSDSMVKVVTVIGLPSYLKSPYFYLLSCKFL